LIGLLGMLAGEHLIAFGRSAFELVIR